MRKLSEKHWLAVVLFAVLMAILEKYPASGATYMRKNSSGETERVEFELDDSTAHIILSDIEDGLATFKQFKDEDIFVWYTDLEGKLSAFIHLTPEEYRFLQIYGVQYILNKKD